MFRIGYHSRPKIPSIYLHFCIKKIRQITHTLLTRHTFMEKDEQFPFQFETDIRTDMSSTCFFIVSDNSALINRSKQKLINFFCC